MIDFIASSNDKTFSVLLHETWPPPQPLLSAQGATGAGCGVRLSEGLQERHLYPCTNFKLNRAAALAEWRQLLSAEI